MYKKKLNIFRSLENNFLSMSCILDKQENTNFTRKDLPKLHRKVQKMYRIMKAIRKEEFIFQNECKKEQIRAKKQ